jgi:hypothetical protein
MESPAVERRSRLLGRVRDDAETIQKLAGGANAPLEQYIDRVSLDALCDSLSLEPEYWKPEDLERILIIRDGLYDVRHKLRDAGDDAEHSVEQILAGMDRLYADLEFAFRELNPGELLQAQRHIIALQRGPNIETAYVSTNVTTLRKEAAEFLSQSHITVRRLELNLIKIENFEIAKSAKLMVQRINASVFAIKLSLEQKVIFEGVFKFLTKAQTR